MKISGKIIEIKETQQVSETFKKRNMVVEYEEGGYSEYITFELIQDRCNLVDGFEVGQEVTVHFNLKGRKWITPEGETRYFNALHAWRLETMDNNMEGNNAGTNMSNNMENSNPVNTPNAPQSANNAAVERLTDDDLPF